MFENGLKLLCSSFEKCGLQVTLLEQGDPIPQNLDMGLSAIIGDAGNYQESFVENIASVRPATIYKMHDQLNACYVYFLMPVCEKIVFIGPYLNASLSRAAILEIAEREKMSLKQSEMFQQYCGMLPVLSENSHLFSVLEAFADIIWNGPLGYTIESVKSNVTEKHSFSAEKREGTSSQDDLWNMQVMEKRYAVENELMRSVANGQIQRAEKLLSSFSNVAFEKRLSDPIRNFKNYCIIMNTLLRKAAEQGGVHPLYLDKCSSGFARRIEPLSSVTQVRALMAEMATSYCRLVRKHKTEKYSSPVQKSIICIDADLTQDLSLGKLAKLQNVSAAYLSALFKKETGRTLTNYVNLKRVEFAKTLLANTDLQIQTIAQHCGILDIHYFSRVFKKYTGVTPKEYRCINK